MDYGVNPRVAAIEGSTIRALHARKKATSIDLGLGEPTLPPTMSYLEKATAWVADHGCRYTPNAGDPELRELIANHYGYPQLDRGENVLITAGGSQEAVYLAIKALLDPVKDELLVVEPAFPVYVKCAQMEGVAVRRVAMSADEAFAFDPDAILAAVGPRTRMVVICSPCNPTARVISRAAVEKIARGLLARGGAPVYVMHDEIYRELTYVGDAGSFALVYPHTVVVNSLSKSNALTGMRIGWIIAPSPVLPAITKAHAWVASTANTYAQRVAIEIFSVPNGLTEHSSWYGNRRTAVLEALASVGLHSLPIDGTFYACVRAGEGVNTLDLAYRLIEDHDVVAIPGSIFSPALEGWLRLSWVAPVSRVREGFMRIARAVQTVAAPG